jgi:hypothetical protein
MGQDRLCHLLQGRAHQFIVGGMPRLMARFGAVHVDIEAGLNPSCRSRGAARSAVALPREHPETLL